MIPELRTLIAVARHDTFAAAGKRLGLTQAGVSGHIRRLEYALRLELFDRTGRSARLNAAGMRIVAQAEHLVSAFDALGDAAEDEPVAAVLRIGAIASAQANIVARALVPFRLQHPACRLHLIPGVSLHLIDKVDGGELDLAVAIRPPFDLPSNLVWVPLVTEDYVLLAPDGTTGADWRAIIAASPFIRYDRSSYGGRQVDRFLRREGVAPHDRVEADDLPAMVALVAKGVGCAIVPESEVLMPFPAGVRHLKLGPNAPSRHVGIVHEASRATGFIGDLIALLNTATLGRSRGVVGPAG